MGKEYDYIIAGAGCAGLSLLMRMIRSGHSKDKKILLIDKEEKRKNDRTWCFWETGEGFFDEIVYRKWQQLNFLSPSYSSTLHILPYQYKMIRGIDFYNYCFNEIGKQPNIDFLYGNIGKIESDREGVTLELDGINHFFPEKDPGKTPVLFNSIPYSPPAKKKLIKLLQHFKGWIIETEKPFFDPGKATLMDFRISQDHGTAFVYVLPFSSNRALVEFTLFTEQLLQPADYDKELAAYIRDWLKPGNYKITDQEFGVIPMSNEEFPAWGRAGFYIGSAGGQTKASSGYTFQFIQKQTRDICSYLQAGKQIEKMPGTPGRFRFYDNTLLHILYHKQLPGSKIFADLFQKNKPQQVLRFLDNETSLREELKIISSLPTWPFLKAALKQF